ncbi:hypothetical protein ASF32_22740 [Methylobacterium sp. Leaf91]|nr:hypothetical protein ASF32_22740 [Methylobacterium sp. Leaf91]
MRGGAGADKYVVEDSGDVVDEAYGQDVDDGAVDSVTTSVDFTLGRFVENLTLTGNARAGTGNDLANKITGLRRFHPRALRREPDADRQRQGRHRQRPRQQDHGQRCRQSP